MNPISTEQRLRDALEAYTETVEPSPFAWTRIEARLDAPEVRRARRSVWPYALAAAALVAMLVVAWVAIVRDDGSDSRRIEPAEPAPVTPAELVVARDDGSVDVIAAADGAVIRRLLAPDDRHLGNVAVSPDGKWLYYDTIRGECDPTVSVVSIAPGAGVRESEPIMEGSDPVLSPDGRYLAVSRSRPASGCSVPNPTLAVRDLTTGAEKELGRPAPVADEFIQPVAFPPDSPTLLYSVSFEGSNGARFEMTSLDPTFLWVDPTFMFLSGVPASGARPVIGGAQGGGALALTGSTSPPSITIRWDRALDGNLVDLGTFPLEPMGTFGATLDRSGRSLALVHDGVAYRVIDGELRRLAEGVRSVAWVPGSTTTSAGGVPEGAAFVGVVGGILGGAEMVYVDESGAALRVLLPASNGPRGDVRLAPDGRSVYYVIRLPNCKSEIRRVELTGAGDAFVTEGTNLDVAADGRLLVGRGGAECGPATLVVARPDGTVERELRLGEKEAISGVSWSPDATQFVYGVYPDPSAVGDAAVPGVFVLDASARSLDGARRIANGRPTDWVTVDDRDRIGVALVVPAEPDSYGGTEQAAAIDPKGKVLQRYGDPTGGPDEVVFGHHGEVLVARWARTEIWRDGVMISEWDHEGLASAAPLPG